MIPQANIYNKDVSANIWMIYNFVCFRMTTYQSEKVSIVRVLIRASQPTVVELTTTKLSYTDRIKTEDYS